jgi:hypothetical protein
MLSRTHDLQPGTGRVAERAGTKWMGNDGAIPVKSEHHQGIRDLAPGLTPVAFAPMGWWARRDAGAPSGWHPEILSPYEPSSEALLRGFVTRVPGTLVFVRCTTAVAQPAHHAGAANVISLAVTLGRLAPVSQRNRRGGRTDFAANLASSETISVRAESQFSSIASYWSGRHDFATAVTSAPIANDATRPARMKFAGVRLIGLMHKPVVLCLSYLVDKGVLTGLRYGLLSGP